MSCKHEIQIAIFVFFHLIFSDTSTLLNIFIQAHLRRWCEALHKKTKKLTQSKTIGWGREARFSIADRVDVNGVCRAHLDIVYVDGRRWVHKNSRAAHIVFWYQRDVVPERENDGLTAKCVQSKKTTCFSRVNKTYKSAWGTGVHVTLIWPTARLSTKTEDGDGGGAVETLPW